VGAVIRILVGHVLDRLRELPGESVHCCVTSPPYYGLRSYGTEPQVWPDGWRGDLGLEPTVELYLAHLVEVFREVRRVLRSDATCWINIGDSYVSGGRTSYRAGASGNKGNRANEAAPRPANSADVKAKDLLMIPAQLALALRADGWWLRSEIVWAKRAPMPESCTDRPTCAHEKVFLLSRSPKYFYDAEAVKEEAEYGPSIPRDGAVEGPWTGKEYSTGGFQGGSRAPGNGGKRNMRNVWHLGPEPFPEAHFATFATFVSEIPRRAIKAGSKRGDTVLDPFLGSGTTALVADQLGRNAIGIELSPDYAAMAERRIRDDNNLFVNIAAE
jgi:DNA modification methylase